MRSSDIKVPSLLLAATSDRCTLLSHLSRQSSVFTRQTLHQKHLIGTDIYWSVCTHMGQLPKWRTWHNSMVWWDMLWDLSCQSQGNTDKPALTWHMWQHLWHNGLFCVYLEAMKIATLQVTFGRVLNDMGFQIIQSTSTCEYMHFISSYDTSILLHGTICLVKNADILNNKIVTSRIIIYSRTCQ